MAHRYTDEIITDDRGEVRLTRVHPNTKLTIQGRTVLAKDVPLNRYQLDCAHYGVGVAVSQGDVVFCEECAVTRKVVKARLTAR